MELRKTCENGLYTLTQPTMTLPIVADSPHSGRTYPDDFAYACDFDDLRRAEDLLLDQIVSPLPQHGIPVLCAEFPRTYIDVNRAESDIDPELLNTPWPGPTAPSHKSRYGFGLVRRLLHPGVPMYNHLLAPADIARRIDTYYRPYHTTLDNMICHAQDQHGEIIHLNIHSMSPRAPDQNRRMHVITQKDIVIGDLNGVSADPYWSRMLGQMFIRRGYVIAYNDPYRGGEIIRRTGAPSRGVHALQIEINKSLYVFERSMELKPRAARLQRDLCDIAAELGHMLQAAHARRAQPAMAVSL